MKRAILLGLFLALLPLTRLVAQAQPVPPDRPGKIRYPKLTWSPPDPAKDRVTRAGFVSPEVFVVEDDSLPLVTLTVHFEAGTAGDPRAEMGAALLLRGGTAKETGDEIRRRIESLGGRISISAGDESGTAQVQVLSRDLPEAVSTLCDVLLAPVFRPEEITRFLEGTTDAWNRQNDRVGSMTARIFRKLVLGPTHPLAEVPSPDVFAKIARKDLLAWDHQVFTQLPLVVTLAGKVPDRAGVLDTLYARLGRNKVAAPALPLFPASSPKTAGGGVVYLVDRPGATQGNVRIGLETIPRSDPDFVPFTVMNYILGGSGFPSRITKTVRSDHGLAYHVGSRIDTGDRIPGTWQVAFESRSAMVPFAISLIRGEIARIRESGVTDAELAQAKAGLLDRMPDRFDTPEGVADSFAELALLGRPDDWFVKWRDRVRAVTRDDVLRVAKALLPDPGKLTILVVGDKKAILAGDPTGAHPEKLSDFGEVRVIPAD